ncbi:MAG: Isoprenylcysteine carboxyl methyltransferase (ICMT) family protein [Bacteroidetes bacterium ADurb.Bin174]|nr:MAG: Isoprenylcysteine carboxyl methyltransferase (ICMT) family protein [Bacteroidetes bacterium ADurb.Bin174]
MALQESFVKQGNFLFRYRSYLPLILVVAGIGVFVANLLQGPMLTDLQYFSIEITSLIVALIGLFIRIITVGHTPPGTSGRNTKEQLAGEINTTGIYSMVRHPLYLGNFLMWAGAVILVANLYFFIIFVLIYWIYYERIMCAEEQFLRNKFGKTYMDWAEQTPAFIPSCRNKKKPFYPFNIKKVLIKEKNGLLAVFILLFIFHNIRYSCVKGKIQIDNNWVLWCTVIAIILYVILKLLKKHSS